MGQRNFTHYLTSQFFLFLIILIFLSHLLSACSDNASDTVEQASVSIGCVKGNSSALVYLAQEKGLFEAESLTVDIVEYQSGVAALSAFFQDEVDLVTASEFAFVTSSFTHKDISILASIANFKNKALLARKDAGIIHPADLKEKKLGVTANSGGEYALGKFLDKKSIEPSQVEIVYMKPKMIVEQLIAGTIDAGLTREPHVFHLKKLMDNKINIWDAQAEDRNFLTLVTDNNFIKNNSQLLTRFLIALEEAENYHKANPQDIEKLLHDKFLYDTPYLEAIRENVEYKVEISNQLLQALIEESEWRIEKGLSHTESAINYRSMLHTVALKKAAPQCVTLSE